ncbi:MAG: glycosyltransferase family 4 protein [Candidatus Omnitrophica bacterium]|nr:glycosyltransferase family 4 protein [Candidatus Omnitrophota bacterium]
MRILQITSHLNVGGVTRYILSLSKALKEQGHEIFLASAAGECDPEALELGFKRWVVSLHTSAEFSPQVFLADFRLRAKLKKEPVDILHAHTRVSQVLSERLSRWAGVPYVTTWHGFFRKNLGRKLWPCVGDRTIAISQPVREDLLHTFQVPDSRIRLIPNGIDPNAYARSMNEQEWQQRRRQIGLPPGCLVVGTISRLVESKGIDLLLRCFSAICMKVPEAHLLIVGDGSMRIQLQRLAEELSIAEKVHFTGSVAAVRDWLWLMDVFVFLPAKEEGFGLTLLEAMATRRPVVALRRGKGAPWVLDQAGVAAVVEPEDQEGLVAAVTGFLRNQQAAEAAGLRAFETVQQHYSLSRMATEVESVYKEVVEVRNQKSEVRNQI